MDGFFIFLLFLAFATIVTLAAGVKTVPQGFQWTIERFGRYHRTLFPGLNLISRSLTALGEKSMFKKPFYQYPASLLSLKTMRLSPLMALCIFQILDAAKAAYADSGTLMQRSPTSR
jgi:hypothetical protein